MFYASAEECETGEVCPGVGSGRTVVVAYGEAGYVGNESAAFRLKARAEVAARVAELQGKAAERVVFEMADALRWHLEVLKTPMGTLDAEHPLAQEYSRTETERSTAVRVKMPSKMDAMKEIAKLKGWYVADKQAGKVGDVLSGLMGAIARRDMGVNGGGEGGVG